MRKVIAVEYVTLDGLFAGPNGEIGWFKYPTEERKEIAEHVTDRLSKVGAFLFGRVTYEMMAGYWPSASASAEDPIFIDRLNNLPKTVFSKTLERVEWKNSKIIKDHIGEETQKMKQQPGKDMVILGSGSIVSAFTDLGLIDEYQFFVNSIVLGKGKRLFKDLNEKHKLELIDTKTFSNGVVLLSISV